MKKGFVISTFAFIIITWITAKIETPFDGEDEIGFPFRFYFKSSGECYPCPDDPISINYFLLFIDLALTFGIINFILFLIKKLIIKKKF